MHNLSGVLAAKQSVPFERSWNHGIPHYNERVMTIKAYKLENADQLYADFREHFKDAPALDRPN